MQQREKKNPAKAQSNGDPRPQGFGFRAIQLDLEELRFLVLQSLVNLVDMSLSDGLELFFGSFDLVLPHSSVFLQGLKVFLGLASDVPYLDSALLRLVAG